MTQTPVELGGLAVEQNGINVIAESERKGKPSDLFWPWCAANISVLAISYGSFVVGFGISFWQATLAGVLGVILSFALCGVVALAGKRGSAPDDGAQPRGLRRQGQRTAVGVVLDPPRRLGDGAGLPLDARDRPRCSPSSAGAVATFTKIVAFLVTAALVVGAGVLGFDVIMRLQTYITLATVRADRRLHRADPRRDRLVDGVRRPVGFDAGIRRRTGPGDHRLRRGLGEHCRRLFALSAPAGLRHGCVRLDHVSAAQRRRSYSSSSASRSPPRAPTCPGRSAPTRSAPSPRCCRLGISCRSRSSRSSAWSVAPCSTSTPPALRC